MNRVLARGSLGLVIAVTAVTVAAPAVGSASGSSGTDHSVTPLAVAAGAKSTAKPVSAATSAATAAPTHGVGVVTATFVDPTRSTPARGDTPELSSRTLAVTIRYPASGPVGPGEGTSAKAASGQYPLVVFVHGYDVQADTYEAMEHELAASGFVVAAPDFPLSSSALAGEAERDPVEQAADVSFVIRSLTTAASTPAPLRGLIAAGKVGVIGHSDGGITAAGVAYDSGYANPAVGAAVVLSGAQTAFPGSWFTGQSPPLLAIHGGDDEVNPYESSEQLFDDAVGPKWLVTVVGGSHLGPFTTDPVETKVSALVADFLRATLGRDTAAAARIATDASVPGALELAARA